jgi:hypothetical protein
MSGDEQVKGNNDTKEEVWFDSKEEAEQWVEPVKGPTETKEEAEQWVEQVKDTLKEKSVKNVSYSAKIKLRDDPLAAIDPTLVSSQFLPIWSIISSSFILHLRSKWKHWKYINLKCDTVLAETPAHRLVLVNFDWLELIFEDRK